jgi:hypothetical protein
MTYEEITDYPRAWDKAKYPVVAHIEIEARDFAQFERKAEDQTKIAVLGHDLSANGRIVVHVACASEAVQHYLEGRWA